MERVNFTKIDDFNETAEKAFTFHKAVIGMMLPEADIQHVGSSAIPNSITKGDLDIQVRVKPGQFTQAVQKLSKLYELNEGSTKTETFRAFKDDTVTPPLGVQLTVINSEFDFFWKFRDVLLMNDQYRQEYDELKKNFEGKDMELYREAKNQFFEKLRASPEYSSVKESGSFDNRS
ncbi:GrpB family protein [Bacillus sp. FJAT-27445]|uniref:GrpB family protein n=1 Tax=Bacillus sp. FJAT-27445 TaxID=1679166 RepID=UPI00074344A0|nr:GrpB family protein [Bacillus sp. FJAT-27445]